MNSRIKHRIGIAFAALCLFVFLAFVSPEDDYHNAGDRSARIEVPGLEGLPKQGGRLIDVSPEHVEACRNGVVRVTLYTRGQLNQADVYLPSHAIHVLADAGGWGYPLSMTIKPDCLELEETDFCRESEALLGLSGGIATFAVNLEKTMTESLFSMAPVESDFEGLRAYRFSPEYVEERLKSGLIVQEYANSLFRTQSGSEAFVNFPKDVDPTVSPTMHVLCKYPKSKPKRPCVWRIATPWDLVAGHATPREALVDWRQFFDRAASQIRSVSKHGVFSNEC